MYAIAMFMFVVSLLALVLGLLQPSLFRFLGRHGTRRHIAVYSLSILLISSFMSSTFEPANIKQARLERENGSATSSEQQKADKLKEQETAPHQEMELSAPPPQSQASESGPQADQNSSRGSSPNKSFNTDQLDFHSDAVKKSQTNEVCYVPGTHKYNRIINYIAYSTLRECLDSGGRWQ